MLQARPFLDGLRPNVANVLVGELLAICQATPMRIITDRGGNVVERLNGAISKIQFESMLENHST